MEDDGNALVVLVRAETVIAVTVPQQLLFRLQVPEESTLTKSIRG